MFSAAIFCPFKQDTASVQLNALTESGRYNLVDGFFISIK